MDDVAVVTQRGFDECRSDAEFIAHARTDIPVLLGLLDETRALVHFLGSAVAWASGAFPDETALRDADRQYRAFLAALAPETGTVADE